MEGRRNRDCKRGRGIGSAKDRERGGDRERKELVMKECGYSTSHHCREHPQDNVLARC